MKPHLTKEKALFLLAVLLLAWGALRLGLLASSRGPAAGPPVLAACSCQQGDPDVADSLATPPLSRLLGPGDPFGLAERTPAVRVRNRPTNPERKPDTAVRRPDPDLHKTEGVAAKPLPPDTGWLAEAKRRKPYVPIIVTPPARPSFELAGTVRLEAPGAAAWAVLRDCRSRALLSGTVGDVLPGPLRIQAIRDNGATLTTPQGTPVTLRGRFSHEGQP